VKCPSPHSRKKLTPARLSESAHAFEVLQQEQVDDDDEEEQEEEGNEQESDS